MKKNVAIIIQNIIQWYAIRDLAFLLKRKNIPTEIIIYNPKEYNNDFHTLATSVFNIVKEDGFFPTYRQDKDKYKVCLAPYSNMITLKSKYRIGYCYGAATTKPKLTLMPEVKINFHEILAHDIYSAELYSVYAKTSIVPYLYINSHIPHKKISKKPVLLYLPTYHEPGVETIAKSLSTLKNNFYIISKGHHGTDFLSEESHKKDILQEVSDEYYDSKQYIKPLLQKADLVLSDNSGAIFDALYCKIPVAIATENLSLGPNGVEPLHVKLIREQIIPYTSKLDKNNIKKILFRTLNPDINLKQSLASDKLFTMKKGGAKIWYDIIEKYLNDDVEQNYCKIHDYLANEFFGLHQKYFDEYSAKLQLEKQYMDELQATLKSTKEQLAYYEKSRLHKAITKLHTIQNRKF